MFERTIPLIALLAFGLLPGLTVGPAAAQGAPDNEYWWPNRLNLEPLRGNSPDRVRWARTSTTPRRSKASTSMR